MGNFIREDIETVWGFVEDAIHLGRNRSLAEDVRILVSVVVQKQKAASGPAATLSESLENTKRLLQRAVEPPAEAVKAKTFHVEWGRGTEAQEELAGAAVPEQASAKTEPATSTARAEATPSAAVTRERVERVSGDADPQRTQDDLIAAEKPVAQDAQASALEEVAVQEKAPSAEMVGAAIELCDWLDRVREDERIAPERAVTITRQKSGSLLAALGVERIEQAGAFNQKYQQVVDSVATDSAEKDMQVCETVRCGYRAKDQIIRPQLVMVYRFDAGKSAARQN